MQRVRAPAPALRGRRKSGLAGALALLAIAAGCVEVPVRKALEPRAAGDTRAETAAPGGGPVRVVLVSIAGLTPDAYFPPDGREAPMPFLASRAAAGVAAERVDAIAPAAPRPVHATLLTGRLPSHHGVANDFLLRPDGAAEPAPADGVAPRGPTLASAARAGGLRTALLGWPASAGLAADAFFPEPYAAAAAPWPALVDAFASPGLRDAARRLGGSAPAAGERGPERDALLVGLACELLAGGGAPGLVALELGQAAPALRRHGPHAPETAAAFAAADAELLRLSRCVDAAGHGAGTAFVIAGDAGTSDLHSVVEPNAALASAGLLVPSPVSPYAVTRWSAYVLTAGGSGFVHARKEEDAVLAREALARAAQETGAFRIVTADEMLRRGADPEAWFGLDAEPGYEIGGAVSVALLHAAAPRGVAGYLAPGDAPGPGFVAFGAGVRERVRVPRLRQVDVGPTVAALLGLSLDAPAEAGGGRRGDPRQPDGRPLVGAIGATIPVAR